MHDRRPADWKGDAVLAANEEGAFRRNRAPIEHRPHQGGQHLRAFPRYNRTRASGRISQSPGETRSTNPARIHSGGQVRSGEWLSQRDVLAHNAPRSTAIFAANDLVAFGALIGRRRELGLNCSKDVSVIGFDNLDIGMLHGSSALFRPSTGLPDGVRAARLILERIKGKKGRAQQIVLPAELRLRNSVAPPPRGE